MNAFSPAEGGQVPEDGAQLPVVAAVDVLVVGAGPVGLTLANILGGHGVSTLVAEERETLIDYPRGVGLDDESLRAFQAIGLVDRILPHTVPHQIMRFVNGNRRVLAEIAPSGEEFGWPRRNAFVQPLVDAELLSGLERHPDVSVKWGRCVESLTEVDGRVEVVLKDTSGQRCLVHARYVVGCDGGRSITRRLMDITFEGTTSPTRWLVVDIRNDPLGEPNIYVGADPDRPYVSVSIAHGIRRFEFMVMAEETQGRAESAEFVQELLARFVPDTAGLDIIRRRVYTHHSRIAGAFRSGRVLLAGDAAHLMPVWQGQGYNSGIRDAVNLGWKLAAVAKGLAGDALLDTYDTERRGHARAMIDLSTTVGKIISPTSRRVAALRDGIALAASAIPQLKRYIVEMRFKPMPRYDSGAVVHRSTARTSPVGRLFIQPRVDTRTERDVLLDDVLGPWFAVVCWNNDPAAVLGKESFALWKALGARFVSVRPRPQLHWEGQDHPDVVVVGDRTGRLKAWFDQHEESVLFLRPDRCVAGACIAQRASQLSRALAQALSLTPGDLDAARSVLPVSQPASRSH
ncbi:bifunctional 3-(3-hydroxy-phenyl)propionate/3-hydroxycinnamic acid hydroxylase [Streptomyces sp. NPDC098781]|uniref:bifunctional 3-(3-hydroxy-phenyl)propionate/3-hydroxycinnamic acid hydroxylase n=1 Tax=Streptomyces sp. NPDC098781 TaxID=3366097 RepID=UPI0037F19D57